MQAGRLRYKEDDRDVRYPAVLVTQTVNSTVDIFSISLECHFPLLPLGKSRWAKPNVAFRGRAGTETETETGVAIHSAAP